MSQLTIRQVEVIRAVMMAGTIQGAAELLNVSAPGVSRLVKYSEESLGIRLFDRKGGLFVPAAEAALPAASVTATVEVTLPLNPDRSAV